MKKMKIKDNIKCVTLAIYAHDGRELEIPLEVWQVGIICEMLGLCVDTNNMDTYQMRSKELVDETMEMYHEAIRKLHREMSDIELKKGILWGTSKQTIEGFDYEKYEAIDINTPHMLWSCYWYPLVEVKKNIPIIAFDSDFFNNQNNLRKINNIFADRKIRTVQVIPESESPYEMNDFPQMIMEWDEGDGYYCFAQYSERFIYDFSKSWLIYSSHECTITFAGEWLVSAIRQNFEEKDFLSY